LLKRSSLGTDRKTVKSDFWPFPRSNLGAQPQPARQRRVNKGRSTTHPVFGNSTLYTKPLDIRFKALDDRNLWGLHHPIHTTRAGVLRHRVKGAATANSFRAVSPYLTGRFV
jgi:hypothetical protein